MMILVMGGSASCKSEYAENRISEICRDDGSDMYYIATMKVYGQEGRERVIKHRNAREGKGFITIEQPLAVDKCDIEANSGILLECMSNLVANEMYEGDFSEEDYCDKLGSDEHEAQLCCKIVNMISALVRRCRNAVIVTNNVFEDGEHYDESTMRYMRILAMVNRMLAEMADEVIEVVVGIPLRLR